MAKGQPPARMKVVLDDLAVAYHWHDMAQLAIVSDDVGSKAWETLKREGFLVQRHPRKGETGLYWVSEKRI